MAVKSYQAQAEGEISLSKGEKIKGKGAEGALRAGPEGRTGRAHCGPGRRGGQAGHTVGRAEGGQVSWSLRERQSGQQF